MGESAGGMPAVSFDEDEEGDAMKQNETTEGLRMKVPAIKDRLAEMEKRMAKLEAKVAKLEKSAITIGEVPKREPAND